VGGTNAIPSTTTKAAIGNWNHTTDRNWHGYIDFIYLWNRVLDLSARRAIQNNPYQFVKPRLSGRIYVAYGITAPTPARGDSGKGSIVVAIASRVQGRTMPETVNVIGWIKTASGGM
jgi:hypothetical protein